MPETFSRKNFLRMGACAALLPAAAMLPTAPAQAADGRIGWGHVGEILRNVRPPRFPRRDFPITAYGTVGDGVTDATAAIRSAVEACHAAGGGRVVVPAGTFLTGAIHLLSNVNLYVSEGATVLFSTDPAAYLPVVLTRFEGTELMNYSPLIYANGCTNVAITGSGILDGQATWDTWWAWTGQASADATRLQDMAEAGTPVEQRVFGAGHYMRAAFIETYRCTNVLVEGVKIVRSPFWEIHPVLSHNVTVQDVRIDSSGPNNDGCDPESCRYVVIRRCTFDVGDDCIAIKSGKGADGLRVNVPSEDILIEDCTMNIRYGAITIGSEMTGGVRNVFVRNCTIGSPNLYFGLYIKTNSVRGGYAENIYLNDIQISNLTKEVVSCDFYRSEGDTGPLTPRVRNVELRNVTVDHVRDGFYMRGYPRSPIQDMRLINCTFASIDRPSTIENVEMTFQNFYVNGELIRDMAQLV